MSMREKEPLPCPFCGDDWHSGGLTVEGVEEPNGKPVWWFVACHKCGCRGPRCYPRWAAVEAWNTRQGKPDPRPTF